MTKPALAVLWADDIINAYATLKGEIFADARHHLPTWTHLLIANLSKANPNVSVGSRLCRDALD